jgi:uncharacterized protein (TIGR02147 family)
MPSVYSFRDYREYIQAQIAASGSEWGLISRMAAAAHCQRSQLSRVLSGHLHLTPDQAFGLSEFWKLDEPAHTYFLKLVEFARASQKRYRDRLSSELDRLRKNQENIAERLRQPPVEVSEVEAFYYSAWHWTALHILVSVPEYHTPRQISERLGLPLRTVESCLERLKKFGLVKLTGGRWSFNSQTTHLPKSSPFISVHHSNWRQRAVTDSQSDASDGLHYTMVQSISEKDYSAIKQMILSMIEEYNRTAGPSKEEELVCFTCDFFRA